MRRWGCAAVMLSAYLEEVVLLDDRGVAHRLEAEEGVESETVVQVEPECRALVVVHALVGEQQRHHRGVPLLSGKYECREAFLAGNVGVHALVGKQQRHHRGVPFDERQG